MAILIEHDAKLLIAYTLLVIEESIIIWIVDAITPNFVSFNIIYLLLTHIFLLDWRHVGLF